MILLSHLTPNSYNMYSLCTYVYIYTDIVYIFIEQPGFSSVSAQILVDPPVWIAIGCQLDSLYRQTSPLVEEQEIFASPAGADFNWQKPR